MNKIFKLLFLILCCVFISFACKRESLPHHYKTKNIIVIILDGSRYSETWGDSLHQYIPKLANQISKFGVINTAFYNNGPTYTLAGHTAINTGCYQEINNSGTEIPQHPSIFQYWNKKFMPIQNSSWIISSKDKIKILNNCQQPEWKNKYKPSVNCGIFGIGSGYREDSLTFLKTIQIFSEQHPQLVLLSFREPDYIAHTDNWGNYLQGIKNTDEFIYKIWEHLQSDIFYKGSTTLFVTNDHGRHLDSIADGFASHGDGCSGCRHILFFAYGPDFKQGVITNTKRELTDISATIAELFHFNIINGNGKVMYELFE
jgi:predicted AlkP superfamily pyrophosphatase or phosphodiesterase